MGAASDRLTNRRRGFLVDGRTDEAVKIIEQTRVYPLGKKDSAPKMVFPNASEKKANMLVTQDISYFENLKPDLFIPLFGCSSSDLA